MVQFTLNGQTVRSTAHNSTPLLNVLANDLQINGAKFVHRLEQLPHPHLLRNSTRGCGAGQSSRHAFLGYRRSIARANQRGTGQRGV